MPRKLDPETIAETEVDPQVLGSSHWSLVVEAHQRSESSQRAMQALCATYRASIESILGARGLEPPRIPERTDEFFYRLQLSLRALAATDLDSLPSFRGFILEELRAFLSELGPESPEQTTATPEVAKLAIQANVSPPSTDTLRKILSAALDAETPSLIGPYRVVKRLGGGLTTDVYEAEAPDGAHVALKRLSAKWSAHATIRERFVREVETLKRFREHSDKVIRIIDTDGTSAAQPFYTMELAIESLDYRERQPLSPERVALDMARAAACVHEAHYYGVLHRDIKPGNILRRANGDIVLADFGIAHVMDLERLTGDRVPLGTPYYMSPEQARGEDVRWTSDVYSLGVVTYELVTGRLPIYATDDRTFWKKLQDDVPARASEWNAKVPPALDDVLAKALAKDPEQRQRSALDFAVELGCIADRTRSSIWSGIVRSAVKKLRAQPRRVAACLLACAVAAALQISHQLGLAQEQARASAELSDLAASANTYANALLAQLLLARETAREVADHSETRRIAVNGVRSAGTHLAEYGRREFDSLTLMTTNGTPLARFPEPPAPYFDMNFEFRDYVSRAQQLGEYRARTPDLVRAFKSEADSNLKYAFVAPIFDDVGRYVGFVLAMKNASATLKDVIDASSPDRTRIVGFLGPRDRDRDASPTAGNVLSVLVHPDVDPKRDDFTLPREHTARIRRAFGTWDRSPEQWWHLQPSAFPESAKRYDQFIRSRLTIRDAKSTLRFYDYRDPVPGYQSYTWAGAAPLGHTGYVVVVQQLPRAPRERSMEWYREFASFGGFVFVIALSLFALIGSLLPLRRRQI